MARRDRWRRCDSLVGIGGIADIGMRWSRKARLRVTQSGPRCGCQLVLHQMAGRLLDRLVGECEHIGRNFEAERFRSFEVDHQRILCRLLDR